MKNIGINGTLALFLASLIAKILGAIYRIPLSNILGAEGIGLYQMAFPIYSFLLCTITGGIGISLTAKIAKFSAGGKVASINKTYSLAKKLTFFMAICLLIGLWVFAYPIALMQGNPKAALGYFAISIGFIFACLLGVYRGYFQGFGDMSKTAISQIIEQVFKLVLGLVFAIYLSKYGTIYAVFGALLAVSVSEIVCFIYFKLKLKKIKNQNYNFKSSHYFNFFKECAPVGISYAILPLSALVDSFLVVNLLKLTGFTTNYATSLYGIQTGMILPLINMPSMLISAIAISAIPKIAFIKEKGNNLGFGIQKMFKITYIFILPCAVGLFILARPILSVVYPTLNPNLLNIAVNLLKFSIFEMFFLSFVTISNAILQALANTKQPAISLAYGILTKIILSMFLLPIKSINIYGLVIASTCGYFVSATINLIKIKKQTMFNLKFWQVFWPVISSFIMGVILLLLVNHTITGIWETIAIVAICAFIYFLGLFFTKQITIKEIKKLLQKS